MFQRVNDGLDRALGVVRVGSLWLARAGGVLILLTVAMVTVEVLSRRLTGRSAVHATELTGYIMAISSSWAFAYTLMQKAHIRIDALYVNLPIRLRGVLDLVALLAMALFCILVVGAAFDIAASSYAGGARANTPLGTPVWIPQALWLLGLAWFALAVGLVLLRVLFALLNGDTGRVQQLAGSPTLDEQLEENKEYAS
ncbi:TRAP transporter small permease subunit [Halomonas sp. MCCC 1A17488]|uniref:TRAP transporter small permease subunit n=1 Tax=unclassified Halomonas TaxID=2609666 RepID=UPI0018D26ED8|nr:MULTISPECIES: TRAP transporter small permease subunit [unclassified Halomonas]MCE8014996.1 TRAP transporter small permease subunit [Halomonas sp. MCCC 1A17488]MCG3238329.1 TRAP transporter small permease subunit [Halomonas sp. MCCC 1A17488]QPP47920.1 TRAP transporter small permease subunit [Halomonas sp. SS10-MC5]